MNTATLTTTFTPARGKSRAENRRVYLDTYAKRRSVEAAQPAAQHPERSQMAAASIPMQMEVPYVQTVPLPKAPSPATLKALSRRAITLSRARNVLSHQTSPAAYTQAPAVQTPSPSEQKLEANLEALYKPSLTEQLLKSNSQSASHVRTVVLSALTCGIVSLSLFAFLTRVDSQPVVAQPIGAAIIEVEAPVTQTGPRGRSAPAVSSYVASKPTDPVKIVISSIGVNAQVQGLGVNASGQIAVPKAYGLVGWYNKGKTVGEAGPTVLVGHYAGGYGAVFDKLGSTKNGDLITVTTKEGKSYTYKITKKVEYQKDKVPMQSVFKSGNESRLEIITCQGAWQGNTYDNRLVVTAELVK